MKFELTKDNNMEHSPINPTITYEIIVDMGENGTKTIFSSDMLASCFRVLNEIENGNFESADLYEEELETIKGLSINVVLTAQDLDIITYDTGKSATAELISYKTIK